MRYRFKALAHHHRVLIASAGISLLLGGALALAILLASDLGMALAVALHSWLILAALGYIAYSIRSHRTASVIQGGSIWGLLGMLSPDGKLLPALGGSAMDPASAYGLIDLIRRTDVNTIVELGPGSSTVLIHLFTRDRKDVKIWSVEHDPHFAQEFKNLMEYHDVQRCTLIEAPLQELELPGWDGRWYEAALTAQLPESIDLLIVDGPPNYKREGNRYPAWPVLADRLPVGAYIFIDDTNRFDERTMVTRWTESGLLTVERDAGTFMILRRQP